MHRMGRKQSSCSVPVGGLEPVAITLFDEPRSTLVERRAFQWVNL